jgi:hypothetical protein
MRPRRADVHLPLDVLPASALRRGDVFLEPVSERKLTVAARFNESWGILLACADEEGLLARVRINPAQPVRIPPANEPI